MKPEISIIMPAIRRNRWLSFYRSLCSSTKRSFELIIVGPFAPEGELANVLNIKYIRDFGCPTRCANMGLLISEGDIFFGLMSDDAILQEGMLDKNIEMFLAMQTPRKKNVISCCSLEGINGTHKIKYGRDYYTINGINQASVTSSPYIPNDWLMMNGCVADLSYIKELGGWDSSFFGAAMASCDLAIRAQIDGAVFQFSEEVTFDLDWMPGTSGDHAPIHYSQIDHDEPLFKKKYHQPLENISPRIDINNWQKSPAIWTMRYKVEKSTI